MVKKLFCRILLFFISFVAIAMPASPAFASLATYAFEKNHTYVIWRVSHFGYSDVTGRFNATGTLKFDEAKPQNSKVEVTIDTANIITGIDKLNKTLQGKSFFDTEQYPTAKFVSKKIVVRGKKAKLYGVLTIRGTSKDMMLNVTLNKKGTYPMSNRKALGFTAIGSLKRSDFGMKGYIPGVSDEVKLEVQAELKLADAK